MSNPREKRLLQILLEKEKVLVKDLREFIGAQNPAQIKFQLKKNGWQIHTDYICIKDRDGKDCKSGLYWLDEKEKQKAIEYLKNDEAEAPASSDCKKSKFKISQLIQNHNNPGGENGQSSK